MFYQLVSRKPVTTVYKYQPWYFSGIQLLKYLYLSILIPLNTSVDISITICSDVNKTKFLRQDHRK